MAETTLRLVAQLAERLSPADKQSLIEHLERQLERESTVAPANAAEVAGVPPRSLRGIWRDHFPNDLDVDAVLHDIRHQWEDEWPEVFHP